MIASTERQVRCISALGLISYCQDDALSSTRVSQYGAPNLRHCGEAAEGRRYGARKLSVKQPHTVRVVRQTPSSSCPIWHPTQCMLVRRDCGLSYVGVIAGKQCLALQTGHRNQATKGCIHTGTAANAVLASSRVLTWSAHSSGSGPHPKPITPRRAWRMVTAAIPMQADAISGGAVCLSCRRRHSPTRPNQHVY